MTGLYDTDIQLDDQLQLTKATDGDAPLCSGLDCLYQNIILEAMTQPGDLFYDLDFGWGLYEFIQSEDSPLLRLEIAERAKSKLKKRDVIDAESIIINVNFQGDRIYLHCAFAFFPEGMDRTLDVMISAVGVEVVT